MSIKIKNKTKMKKLFVLFVMLSISICSFAQITDIKVSDEVKIDRIYAGSLSGTMFHADSLYATGFTGVRFGAMGTYRPASWISFSSWAMLQVDGGAKSWNLQQFYITLNPTKKLTLQVGSMATLVTEQRPHPVSGNGQFETWSEATIPGGSLNAKLKYDFTSDFQLAAGIAVRSNMPEYSVRLTYKKVKLYGWYSACDSTLGAAATVDFGRVYSTLVYKPDQTIADVLVIKLSKKHDISIYSDVVYDFQKKDLVRAELGLMKCFESKWIDGLFGFGWDQKKKCFNAYLFAHL